VAGNVLVGAQASSTSATTTMITSAAGTFGAASASGTSASIVFNGKLFVATKKADAAAVYRYDGGTTWTMVTNAVGKVLTGDTATVDGFSMVVYNGKLYIGTQSGTGGNAALLYVSSDADTSAGQATWTAVNSTAGTFVASSLDGVGDMVVFNGHLIFTAQEPNLADVYLYLGGTGVTGAGGFVRINNAAGKLATGDAADAEDFRLASYGGRLWAGAITGTTTARVEYWDGVIGTWTLVNTTRGQFTTTATTVTGLSDVNAMVVYNGSLIVGVSSSTIPNRMNVYKYDGGIAGGVTAAGFERINNTSGKLASTDSADINSINVLEVYNGKLYAGTNTASATSTGAFYQYDPTNSSTTQWTLMNSARGSFGAQASIDEVSTMTAYNGTLYIGTYDLAGNGAVYTWSQTTQNSFALKFDSGSANYGQISFVGNQTTQSGTKGDASNGSFLFSNSLILESGSFDYAEDFPTWDNSLNPGEVVQIDKLGGLAVKRAESRKNLIGVVSEKPGFRLSSQNDESSGAKFVPIALAGRVPVKVSTENGEIKTGDYVTLSSIPGFAMKATFAGEVLGQALEDFQVDKIIDCPKTGLGNLSTTKCGSVTIFVNMINFGGENVNSAMLQYNQNKFISGLEINPESSNETVEAKLSDASQIPVTINPAGASFEQAQVLNYLSELKTNQKDFQNGSEIFTGSVNVVSQVISPEIIADLVKANSLEVNQLSAENFFATSGVVENLSVSSISGIESADVVVELTANNSFVLNYKASSTDDSLTSFSVASIDSYGNLTLAGEVESPTIDRLAQAQENIENILQQLGEKINGLTNALALTEDGDVQVSGGLSVAGLAIFNGGLLVDEIGDEEGLLALRGDVEFFGRPYFTSDTAGFAIIYAGQTLVDVVFDREYLQQPIINTSISQNSGSLETSAQDFANAIFNNDIRFVVVNKNEKGFQILLNKPAPTNIEFSWMALAVNNAKTFSLKMENLQKEIVVQPALPAPPILDSGEILGQSTTTTPSEVAPTSSPPSEIQPELVPVEPTEPVVPVIPAEPVLPEVVTVPEILPPVLEILPPPPAQVVEP
jgi:hypothetical protein